MPGECPADVEEGSPAPMPGRATARETKTMFLSSFDTDPNFDAPTGADLLAEFGIHPAAVRETIEDDRARRCPERDPMMFGHQRAAFGADAQQERTLREAALIERLGSSQAFPRAE